MIKRYSTEEMNKIWSEQNTFDSWLKVELFTAKAFSVIKNEIPESDIDKLFKNAKFDLKRIKEIEQITKHDVIAFTRAVSESLGSEKKWIHYGLTSTDVVDTAFGYRLKQANEIIKKDLSMFIDTLKKLAIEHQHTYQIGRTHGIHGEITTFGYKVALWFDEMTRNIERFEEASRIIEIGKISGAVGNYANIDPEIQDYVCEQLGINSSKISTQTLQRDRHAQYIFTLSLIGSSLDKIAVELRHLQRTEVGEVEEGFAKGQKGSSAMPHKKNPISSENISGLSRLLRSYTFTALENVPLWHERDISHSSNERVIFPDSTTLISYMLRRMNRVLNNLGVKKEKMMENIGLTHGSIFSQRVMLTIISDNGITREEAYDKVQPIAIDCYSNKKDFKTELLSKNVISDKQATKIFDYSYYSRNIDKVFSKLGIK
ncbi:adenylosuccinate lyase [Mycoplasma marinum]|uniref:Adenylosuccinate lyase n=1 Tax=Mycoplasma marinum TaxID=1937190 RepID=A0A4V2NIA4_9MOLU|nr:adenylosuccinate lyase [Mycoplasma marinum]TCG12016.1 adenylosuccinate lyase [Mycoplasma marinum]